MKLKAYWEAYPNFVYVSPFATIDFDQLEANTSGEAP